MKLRDFVLNDLKGVIIIAGKKGSGKSLSATMIAYTYWKYMHQKGYKVYANYQLNFPFIPVTKLSTIDNAQKGLVIIDEAYQLVDSRRATSSKNVLFSVLLGKARKHGIRILFIAQYVHTLDSRIRQDADWIIVTSLKNVDVERKIPLSLEWDVYYRDDLGDIVEFEKFTVPVPPKALKLYDSYADIFPIEDDISEQKRRKSTGKQKT